VENYALGIIPIFWQVFYYLISRLSTKRLTNGAIIKRLGKAIIQLFNQEVIHKPNNASTNPAVLRTETPDTTPDMQIETKNINVTCPYLAGIISALLTFLKSQL
tara:strand:+ start:380 stop:691 length:312 start_codon:yes stop_codon:yes gene_type:complete